MLATTVSFLLLIQILTPVKAFTQSPYEKACPILGLEFPNLRTYASNPAVGAAMKDLHDSIASTVNNTSVFGRFDSTGTAFSADVYSLADETALFNYHFTPQELQASHTVGVNTVDSNSVYRIGSVSKLLTVYLYLAAAGDKTWNTPVTSFVPELASYVGDNQNVLEQSTVDTVDWSSITIGALASQMAGLARDAAYSGSVEQALGTFGLPPPPKSHVVECGDDSRLRLPCNRTSFFRTYLSQHPVTKSFETPIYSNAAYQILSYALENITGTGMPDLFQSALVKPLGLESTFYTVPATTNNSFIPFNTSVSWWDADARDESPAGGYYSSINDMRKIGKAMLNSTLLTPAQTRKWMKPLAFTSNVNFSVGAPWEIVRAPSERVSWMFSKTGNLGAYAAVIALLPDYNIGFSVLAAGTDPVSAVQILSDLCAAYIAPAAETASKANAASTYAGTYTEERSNSTITISTTDKDSGLVVSNWKLAGEDVLSLMGTLLGVDPTEQNLTARLYYSGLESRNGSLTSWRASYQALPQPADIGAFSSNCISWQQVDLLTYAGIGLDEFVFTLDPAGSTAVELQPRVLGIDLVKATGVSNTKLTRRFES